MEPSIVPVVRRGVLEEPRNDMDAISTTRLEGPLAGVRVLDLSRFIAGPLCAQILADMGAEVIKVERPAGEDARHHAPFVEGESLYVMMYNRNKYGITLNTRHERGRDLLGQLVAKSDVVVENFRPGTMAAMGFAWEDLHRAYPGLILTSISGFGQTGPLAGRALFDAIAQAMSGLMSLTGQADDAPVLTGAYIADYVAGYHGAIGTLTALLHRQQTGDGQWVDVGSLDALFSCLGTHPSAAVMLGLEPQRRGSRDQLTAPANVFRAADSFLYIHAGTDPLFPRLCEAMGRRDLAEDQRFRDVPGRMANVEILEKAVQSWVAEQDYSTIAKHLEAAKIPFGRVATVNEIARSEQIAAREMLVEIDHATAGRVTLPGMPIKLSESSARIWKAPPALGEDNNRVYGELLDLDGQQIEKLHCEGVI